MLAVDALFVGLVAVGGIWGAGVIAAAIELLRIRRLRRELDQREARLQFRDHENGG